MARDLVAVRVTIGLRPNGEADHPDLNLLPTIAASGMDWSRYIDQIGIGWVYDVTAGHQEPGDTPVGQQHGVILLPAAVADEALAAFAGAPYEAVALTPPQFRNFHDDKGAVRLPAEKGDQEVLARIKAKRDAGTTLSQDDLNALDPTHREPGIRRNRKRRWNTRSTDEDVNVIVKP